MEYEIVERPRRHGNFGDGHVIREQRAFAYSLEFDADDDPERFDQALLIPEEEPG